VQVVKASHRSKCTQAWANIAKTGYGSAVSGCKIAFKQCGNGAANGKKYKIQRYKRKYRLYLAFLEDAFFKLYRYDCIRINGF
jgi:hypothetical protein